MTWKRTKQFLESLNQAMINLLDAIPRLTISAIVNFAALWARWYGLGILALCLGYIIGWIVSSVFVK